MTDREILTKKLASYQFMIQDLKLYLNTHPRDRETLMKLEEYQRKLEPIVKLYEEKYGPLFASNNDTNKWRWVKSPWPWETEEDD